MNAKNKKLLCGKCRKRVSYHVHKRPAKIVIKGTEICYDEYYGTCDECKAEIFVPGLDDENIERINKLYREEKQLIAKKQIEEILTKYNIEKRPLSRLLGFGELTITRYLDGQMPSKKYSDILYEILNDEQQLKTYIIKNKDVVSEITLNRVSMAIERVEKDKSYQNTAERIALYIVNTRKEITNLLLQKLLYYIKGLSTAIEGVVIIPDPCEAWRYGPVFPTVYEKYKRFAKGEISINLSEEYTSGLLSDKEKHITDYVLDTFGIYNAWFLKDLTHSEEPWKEARGELDESDMSNNTIEDDVIADYFDRMNKKYNLGKPEGVECYVTDIRKAVCK